MRGRGGIAGADVDNKRANKQTNWAGDMRERASRIGFANLILDELVRGIAGEATASGNV